MKTREAGFGIIEQLVVTMMGALFVIMFVHGTLIVVDRFFSVQTITSFDEDRKVLRAQVATWASVSFNTEIYLSNEILAAYNVQRPDGQPILPYPGSYGSGVVMSEHVVQDGAFVRPEDGAEAYDIAFLLIRDPEGESFTVTDDESGTPSFIGNPGLYRFNQSDPYVYVDRAPEALNEGDFVALSSVAGAGFAKVKKIEDRKITFDFDGLGEFRPDDPVNRDGPFVVFYKGGTISRFQIIFVGVRQTENEAPQIVLGRMNRAGGDTIYTESHLLKLPAQSLRLVRGSTSAIPGGTFIPFETPQQLAASMIVPSFISSRLDTEASRNFFDSEMTFLVPL